MSVRRRPTVVAVIAGLLLVLLQAGIAFAHTLAHPVSGLDHVLAMIAVGLWGAQLGAPAIRVLPVAFPMMIAMGGMLALVGVPLAACPYFFSTTSS